MSKQAKTSEKEVHIQLACGVILQAILDLGDEDPEERDKAYKFLNAHSSDDAVVRAHWVHAAGLTKPAVAFLESITMEHADKARNRLEGKRRGMHEWLRELKLAMDEDEEQDEEAGAG